MLLEVRQNTKNKLKIFDILSFWERFVVLINFWEHIENTSIEQDR